MKIILFTDIHANLPALEEFIKTIKIEGYDLVFHLGDAVNIGPFPSETLELLKDIRAIDFIRGNHESFVINSVPFPYPDYIGDKEQVDHFEWTFDQLRFDQIKFIRSWSYIKEMEIEGYKLTFVHYGLNENQNRWVSWINNPIETDLKNIFKNNQSDLFLYGHDHNPTDMKGASHYINPGSAGCNKLPQVRFTVIQFYKEEYKVEHKILPYDKSLLIKELRTRKMPASETIEKLFY